MIFNKSIVISLKTSKRRQRIVDQKINHEFFNAIDGNSMSDEEFNDNVSDEGYNDYLKYNITSTYRASAPNI